MAEDRPTISSSRLAAADVARHSFGTVRRGFDPAEVRTFLEAVARELSTWEQRELELRREVAAAEEKARNPVIDEATLTSSLGQQSAQVLRKAHEQADAIVREAEERAAGLRQEAHQHVVTAEASAAERIAESELSIGALHQQLEAESAERRAADSLTREEMLARTREEGRALIEEAQAARKRVLADLAQRRRTINHQIEQFRAARDEIAAAVLNVRDSVDRVIGDLSRADDDARAAAAEVRSRQPADVADPPEVLIAEVTGFEVVTDADGDGAAGAVDEADEEVSALETAETPVAVAPVAPVADAPVAATAAAEASVVEVTDGDSDEGLPETHDVEALFARLRAGSPDEVDEVTTPVRPPPPHRPSLPKQETVVEAVVEGVADGGGDGAAGAESGTEDGDGEAEEEFDDGPSGVSGEDAGWLERRAVLLDPVTVKLAKRLKRALQDDQNQLLNRIRAANGKWADDMVPTMAEHQQQYATAASGPLGEAWTAGDRFARAELGAADGVDPDPADPAAIGKLADELATSVVTTLRRRLSPEECGGGEAADRVGAAYREWRGERIEGLVGDFAVAAFSVGTLTGAGGKVGTRWVLAAADGACADCDDNSLAGSVAPGEEFPTGHLHPPAHSGCRCLVVPTQG